MSLNDSTILGFKYSENEEKISLSPPKGNRTVSYLRLDGTSFHWFRIPEPPHDSNKLYTCFRGIPTNTAVELDLEDLGVEADAFNTTGDKHDDFQLKNCIGAGWMKSSTDEIDSNIMVACGQKDHLIWRIIKLEGCPANWKDVSNYTSSHEYDIVVPLVQPKKVQTSNGVYFVG